MEESFAEIKRELYELMQRMRRVGLTPPTPDGVTPLEARTMMAVHEVRRSHGETRPGRIAEFAHTTPSALSQAFKSLEEKGLIERHRSGDDYRGVTVSLTPEGERLAGEGRQLRGKHLDEVMAHVGEEDARHLVRILRKVVEFHEGEDGCARPSREEGDAPCA